MTSSVVIVSHRPTEWLERSIESVADQADEVIVVDNGSAGCAATDAARRQGARVVLLPTNTGFAGGVNAGVTAANGDLVALLNDDAVAGAGWLTAAAETLEDPAVAAVGPKIVLKGRFAEFVFDDEPWFAPSGDPRPLGRELTNVRLDGVDVLERLLGTHDLEEDGDRRWRWTAGRRPVYVRVPDGATAAELEVDGEAVAAGRIVTLINSSGLYLRHDGYAGDIGDSLADDGQFDGGSERFSVTGAAMVARSETFRRVGMLDRRFFAYYEDTDWCWRARLAGMRFVYDPSTTVTHVRGQTSGGTAVQRVRYLSERNRLLCLLRNAPLRVAMSEVQRKRTGGGSDGVAEELWKWTPLGLSGRAANSRRWKLTPTEVFERWAGVSVP